MNRTVKQAEALVQGFFSKILSGPVAGDLVSYARYDDIVQHGQVLGVSIDGTYLLQLPDGDEVEVQYSQLVAKLQPVVSFTIDEVYNQEAKSYGSFD